MPLLPDLLRQGGRVVIISFHSIEDRIVKRFFAEHDRAGYEAQLRLLIKKADSGCDVRYHQPACSQCNTACRSETIKQKGPGWQSK